MSDLVIAIDVSRDGVTVIAVVGVEEHVLKSSSFLYLTSWAKHYREIPSHRKNSYMKRFPARFSKILPLLSLVRIYLTVDDVKQVLQTRKPVLVLIDDKLVKHVENTLTNILIIPEKNIKYKHHEVLITLADNLANYFRVLLNTNPRKLRKELEKFEK